MNIITTFHCWTTKERFVFHPVSARTMQPCVPEPSCILNMRVDWQRIRVLASKIFSKLLTPFFILHAFWASHHFRIHLHSSCGANGATPGCASCPGTIANLFSSAWWTPRQAMISMSKAAFRGWDEIGYARACRHCAHLDSHSLISNHFNSLPLVSWRILQQSVKPLHSKGSSKS